MKRIVKVDAQGEQEIAEEVRRFNAERRRIEGESSARTGRPPKGFIHRMIALSKQAAPTKSEASEEEDDAL